jgi:BirA family biotin operon repressor/biotin-[acetyl-CoA-carboxylase] ligase
MVTRITFSVSLSTGSSRLWDGSGEADRRGIQVVIVAFDGDGGRVSPTWDIRVYETIDSTNLEARRLLGSGASSGLVVTARHQTMGKGRVGRSWMDLPGKSLMVSIVLDVVGGFEAGMLVALSARAAVVEAGGEGPLCKWPNDLVYGARKVGGILSESCRVGEREYIITGLGLNLDYLPGELDIPARLPPTSLLVEEGRIWNHEELLRGILRGLEARLGVGRGKWLEEYRENLAYLGRKARVGPPFSILDEGVGCGAEIEGVIEGVDDGGNLLLAAYGRTLRLVTGDIYIDGIA